MVWRLVFGLKRDQTAPRLRRRLARKFGRVFQRGRADPDMAAAATEAAHYRGRPLLCVTATLGTATTMRDISGLIIGTVLWWIAAVPGAGVAVMTPMMFDAPQSVESAPTIALALAVVSFPILAALCPVFAWVMYALKFPRAARVLIYLPFIPVVGVALSVAVIEFACAGSLTCR